jgi:hypothetical protein
MPDLIEETREAESLPFKDGLARLELRELFPGANLGIHIRDLRNAVALDRFRSNATLFRISFRIEGSTEKFLP